MAEIQLTDEGKKRMYWASVGVSVKEGFVAHQQSGQLDKGPDSWRNVTEHCLVEVARAEILAKWIGLPEDVILDIKMGSVLHDFDKKEEIIVTKQADANGQSPLIMARDVHEKDEALLKGDGFSARVRKLAASAGGDAPQLIEAQEILNKYDLSDDDWAYLLVHYVDDCSIRSDWVKPVSVDRDGRRVNIIDYRAEENKDKPTYRKISEEIGKDLRGTPFEGMNNHDAMTVVSHQIEKRLAQRILARTGEAVDPLEIPELVDQKIRENIGKM